VDTGFIDRELAALVGPPLNPALSASAIAEEISRTWQPRQHAPLGPGREPTVFELGGLGRISGADVIVEGEAMTVEVAWSRQGPRIEMHGAASGRPHVEIVWGDGEAFVLQGGRQLRVVFPDPLAREHETGAASGEVPAPMHGCVVTVSVSAGAHVERGDALFSLEAMKMEHNVVAPLAGTVKTVRSRRDNKSKRAWWLCSSAKLMNAAL